VYRHAHFLPRWAAKEAIKKASSKELAFNRIMILSEPSNRPFGVILDHPVKMSRAPSALPPGTEETELDPSPEDGKISHQTTEPDDGVEEPTVEHHSAQEADGGNDDTSQESKLRFHTDSPKSVADNSNLTSAQLEEAWSRVSGQEVELSISHDGDYTIANCILLEGYP
jgi:phosphopantetheinyl transferase (holo-ACP synthase)